MLIQKEGGMLLLQWNVLNLCFSHPSRKRYSRFFFFWEFQHRLIILDFLPFGHHCIRSIHQRNAVRCFPQPERWAPLKTKKKVKSLANDKTKKSTINRPGRAATRSTHHASILLSISTSNRCTRGEPNQDRVYFALQYALACGSRSTYHQEEKNLPKTRTRSRPKTIFTICAQYASRLLTRARSFNWNNLVRPIKVGLKIWTDCLNGLTAACLPAWTIGSLPAKKGCNSYFGRVLRMIMMTIMRRGESFSIFCRCLIAYGICCSVCLVWLHVGSAFFCCCCCAPEKG